MLGTVVPIDAASPDETPDPGFCPGADAGFSAQATRTINAIVKKPTQTVGCLIFNLTYFHLSMEALAR